MGRRRLLLNILIASTFAGSKKAYKWHFLAATTASKHINLFYLASEREGLCTTQFYIDCVHCLFQCCHCYFSLRLYNFKIILYIFDLFCFSETSWMTCQQFTRKKEGNSNCCLEWAVIGSKGWIKICCKWPQKAEPLVSRPFIFHSQKRPRPFGTAENAEHLIVFVYSWKRKRYFHT